MSDEDHIENASKGDTEGHDCLLHLTYHSRCDEGHLQNFQQSLKTFLLMREQQPQKFTLE